MTQVTPPGWYPDPGQTSDGPATERWWDGKAWTEQTRPAGSAAAWGPPVQPPAAGAYPVHPGYPGVPPAGRRRGLRTGIAVGAAVVVLACIGVGVYALAGDDGSDGTRAGSSQGQGGPGGQGGPFGESGGGSGGPGGGSQGGPDGGSGGSGGQSPAPEGSEAPKVDSGSVTDAISGISLPIPDGWYGQEYSAGAQVTSDDSYDCPGDTSQSCTKGGAYSAPALALGTQGDTAEEIAKADISDNAEESYGGKTYGSITSHDVLASKAVTVAGQKGYLVRWKAVTSKGADGYVESLAFPSPADLERIVVVRFGVDADQKQSVIDEITEGIKVSSGTGNGQKV
ncbi:membrane protein [Streptomyces fumigatiscleroticus]|nr:membrane protein [Streptomyces fumigatiscleroticus]